MKNDVNMDTSSSCSNSRTIPVWPLASSPLPGDPECLLGLGNMVAAFLFFTCSTSSKPEHVYQKHTDTHTERLDVDTTSHTGCPG